MPVRGDNSLFFTSGLDTSGLSAGARTALGIVQSMATSIGAISPFAILSTGAIAAFGAIGNHAYDMMKKFESAMAEVKTIANVTEGEFEKLQEKVFGLAKELGTEEPEALAKGLYDIIGAGYEAADALKILEISSKAATAGVTTSAVAADGLTTILNAFGLAASDAAEVADIMFATVDRGKISFEELSSQISQVAPLAAASGFSFKEIAAAVATLTKQGVPASVAMTQIRSGIISVGEVLGSAASETLTLQAAFQELYKRAGGDQDKLKLLAGRIEAVSAVLSIAGPNFKGATEDLIAMGDAAGSVNRSFETVTSTTENQWKILGNRISATTSEIGKGLLVVSNGLARFLNESIKDSDKLKKSFDEQRLRLFELERGLKTAVVGSEEYKKIRQEIIDQYPEFLSGINTETASTEDLIKVLDRVNESYRQRYKLAQRTQELQKEEQKAGNIELKIENYEIEFKKTLDRLRLIAEDNNIELDIDPKKSNTELIRSIENQLKGVEGALDKTFDTGDKFKQTLKGFAAKDLSLLRQYSAQVVGLTQDLKEQNKVVNQTSEDQRRITQLQLKTETGRANALRKIAEAMKASDLESYTGSGIAAIDKAIEERMAVINKMRTIDQTDSVESLRPFLEDELSEIKKYAEERQRIINTEYKGNGAGAGGAGDPEKRTYVEYLNERKKEYEAYYAAIEQLGKESADKIFESLLASGADFNLFLQDQLAKAETLSQKKDIVAVASSSGIDLKREIQTVVSALEDKPIVLGVELDTTSLNFLNRELDALREKKDSALTQGDRDALQIKIDAKEKEIEIAEEGIAAQKDLYENFHINISDLRNEELRKYIEYWQKKLAIAKKGSDAAAEAETNIETAKDEMAQNTADTIRQLAAVFGEASALARKFGDEDLAKLLDQLQGVGNGVATTIAGFLKKDPLAIAQGVLQVLNSAITVEVESDTAKFEAAITRLNKAIQDLDYAISRGIGTDKVSGRLQSIDQLKELQEQAQLAIEAEKEAEKRVKFLGITVGKKGKGSGTDQAKLDQLAADAEEARRRVEELKDELDELYTGTTSRSITDSIIEGFRNGKFAIEDFTQGFEDMMKEAMLNAFQLKYLEEEVANFYEIFSNAGEDGTFTAAEIENLRAMYATMIEGAQSDIEAINDILNASGIGSIGEQGEGDQREGLSGAITNITEDTANLLAGYMNAVRLDIRQGLGIAITNSQYLSQIAVNTSYNRYLESIDGRMGTIERAIRDAQAQG